MTTERQENVFRDWCILELMGHRQLAGMVQEQEVGGAMMLRIDVPETEETPAYTQFYSSSAIYSITPVTEQLARAMAKEKYAPVRPFDLRLPAPVRNGQNDEIPW